MKDRMRVLLVCKTKMMENLGVMYLAAVVKQAGHDARIVALNEVMREAEKYKPDIIGYSIMTGDRAKFLEVNKQLKKRAKFVSIVGGPDPTFFREGYDDEPSIDSVITGEGEQVFADLLQSGLKYPDIDAFPWPDRTDFPDMRVRDFIASRGCVGRCRYCVTGDTLILKEDMSVVSMKEIKIGDRLVGIGGTEKYKKIVVSTVLHKWKTHKPVYRITLENGTFVRCSSDHRWLSDRGWKYVTQMVPQRPFLTTKNKIRTLGSVHLTPPVTEDFMKGYLSGMIRGDGHLAKHGPYKTPYGKDYFIHQFRLCLKDNEPLVRTRKFLAYFGIGTEEMIFTEKMDGIRTARKDSYIKIKSIIKWSSSGEYQRGFLSGIYDAEGSYSQRCLRISNSNQEILRKIKNASSKFGFDCVFDCGKKGKMDAVRLRGGEKEHVRFWQLVDPSIARKRTLRGGTAKGSCKIKSIEKLQCSETMYDIQTSSENFIANGMIAHNCFNDQWASMFPETPRLRQRSAKDVVAEIASVKPEYVYFQDSCFGISTPWLKDFGERYLKEVAKPFQCHLRPNQVTEERVLLLGDCGCISVRIALESASSRLRTLLNRGKMDLAEVRHAVGLMKKWGIRVMLQSMIGLPDGNIDDDLETLAFNIRVKPTYAWASIFQPYPGTEMGRWCEDEGWYNGDYSEIGDNFFDRSVLNFSEKYKEQIACLQKVFALCTEMDYLPEAKELTQKNFPGLVHKIMRKVGDKRLYAGVL